MLVAIATHCSILEFCEVITRRTSASQQSIFKLLTEETTYHSPFAEPQRIFQCRAGIVVEMGSNAERGLRPLETGVSNRPEENCCRRFWGLIRHYQPLAQCWCQFGVKTGRFFRFLPV